MKYITGNNITMKEIAMKHTIVVLSSCLAATNALASTGFHAETTVIQAEGAHLDLGLALSTTQTGLDNIGALTAIMRLGATENTNLDAWGKIKSEAFFSTTVGVAATIPFSDAIKQYSELSIGADGIGLKNARGSEASHFIVRSLIGVRLESSNKQYMLLGTGLQLRTLPETNRATVNGRILARYSVTPAIGIGWSFL